MKCRRCKVKAVNRPRGLCWTCYYTPGVREACGKLDTPFNNRGYGVGLGAAPLPSEPTDHPPGSKEKVEVMIERCKNGLTLWHPKDMGLVKPQGPVPLHEASDPYHQRRGGKDEDTFGSGE